MKKITLTPKVKTSTTELYEIQRRIAHLARKMQELKDQETELIATLEPRIAKTAVKGRAEVEVRVGSDSFTVNYTHVDRMIPDTDKIARIFDRLGKRIPRKHNEYTLMRVVKL